MQTVPDGRWSRLWHTLQAMRRSNADVIHVHDRRSGLPGIIAGIVLGIPVVLTDDVRRTRTARRLLDWLSLDRVIHSDAGPSEPAGLVRVATQSIPDALEEPVTTATAMTRLQRRLGGPSGPVLLIAGDGSTRSIDTTTRALDTVFATYPDAVVLFAGEASDWSSAVDRHGGAGRQVHLLSRGELTAGLATAHLFIDVSTEVARVDIMASALAAGLAVVVTDLDTTGDLAEDEFAIRIPPDHPDILANAIVFALSNPSGLMRRGRLAQQRTMERFGSQAWAETVHAVYRDVADGRSVTL